jgi:hypothetical protein
MGQHIGHGLDLLRKPRSPRLLHKRDLARDGLAIIDALVGVGVPANVDLVALPKAALKVGPQPAHKARSFRLSGSLQMRRRRSSISGRAKSASAMRWLRGSGNGVYVPPLRLNSANTSMTVPTSTTSTKGGRPSVAGKALA